MDFTVYGLQYWLDTEIIFIDVVFFAVPYIPKNQIIADVFKSFLESFIYCHLLNDITIKLAAESVDVIESVWL